MEGYVEDEGDAAAVSGLAEELRDILLEYWVSISLGEVGETVWLLKLVLG